MERARAQPVIDIRCFVDRMDAGDQGSNVYRTIHQEVQEAAKIAALGPANVAGRVVDALELVTDVVATRPIGPREADVQLLVVVGVPGQVEARLSDVHHAGTVPRQPGGHLDRSVRVAARS